MTHKQYADQKLGVNTKFKWPARSEWRIDPAVNTRLTPGVHIVDVIRKKSVTSKTRKWFRGDYGYVLENIVILKHPVPVKGSRGIWKLKGRALKECLSQLSKAQLKYLKPFEKIN